MNQTNQTKQELKEQIRQVFDQLRIQKQLDRYSKLLEDCEKWGTKIDFDESLVYSNVKKATLLIRRQFDYHGILHLQKQLARKTSQLNKVLSEKEQWEQKFNLYTIEHEDLIQKQKKCFAKMESLTKTIESL
jgi:hypothetical protein